MERMRYAPRQIRRRQIVLARGKNIMWGKVHGKHAKRIKSCEGCGFYLYLHILPSKPSLAQQLYHNTRGVDVLRSSLRF